MTEYDKNCTVKTVYLCNRKNKECFFVIESRKALLRVESYEQIITPNIQKLCTNYNNIAVFLL